MEDWGEEIFAEGVGVKWKNERVGRGRGRKNTSPPPRHCTNPLPVKHLITIKDGGIESLIYLAFRSKITPALQANKNPTAHVLLHRVSQSLGSIRGSGNVRSLVEGQTEDEMGRDGST